jgi:hypothetical protein
LVIRRVVDRLAAAVADDPHATESERESLLFLLEAADEHCWRSGAFHGQETSPTAPTCGPFEWAAKVS